MFGDINKQVYLFRGSSKFNVTTCINSVLHTLYSTYKYTFPALAEMILGHINNSYSDDAYFVYTMIPEWLTPESIDESYSIEHYFVFACYRLEQEMSYPSVHLEVTEEGKLKAVRDSNNGIKFFKMYNGNDTEVLSHYCVNTVNSFCSRDNAVMSSEFELNQYSQLNKAILVADKNTLDKEQFMFEHLRMHLEHALIDYIHDLKECDTLAEVLLNGSFLEAELSRDIVDLLNTNFTFYKCKDCGRLFAMTPDSAKWYTSKGLVIPKRCSECRSKRNPKKKGNAMSSMGW